MRLLFAGFLAFSLISGAAFAQEKKEPSAAQKKQQERMKDCNAQAAAKKMEGDARKGFMSSCLKGETTSKGEKMTAQQSRMRDCNAQAAAKKMEGDARKGFMSTCLKGK